jgi:hypothetical protein
VPEPAEIRAGDIVQVHRVDLYYARVERAGAREVVIQPLNPRIPDRRVRVEEIRRRWRANKPPSLAQLRL